MIENRHGRSIIVELMSASASASVRIQVTVTKPPVSDDCGFVLKHIPALTRHC